MAYSGSRDPRFVTVRRGGTLDDDTHHLLAVWSADCAARVLDLFEREHPGDTAAREAARAAGHAVATAHMADHELGGAAYAIRAIRDLVLDDMRQHNTEKRIG